MYSETISDLNSPITTNEGVLSGIFAALAGIWLVIFAFAVFMVICSWKIYQKAGKPGWAAIVPVYNIYVLMKIIGKPWWWTLGIFLVAIPLLGSVLVLIWSLVISLELGQKFGKDIGFSILLLWLFSFIGYPILAFGNAQYNPKAPAIVNFPSENKPLASSSEEKTTKENS